VERRPNGTFFCRILLEDGTQSGRIDLPGATTREQAREMAKALAAAEARTKTLLVAALAARARPRGPDGRPAPVPGSVNEWWEKYIAAKDDIGEGHRRVVRGSWRKWIAPVIGRLTMSMLTPEDCERVRDRLDAAIKAKAITSGTAENVWSTLTTAMKAATNSKNRGLRVHQKPDFPVPVTSGILPPNGGRDRARPFLYPFEWLTLATCPEVPPTWRRTYAIALYIGLRPGELRVLTWDDIELEAGLVRVNKAWDPEERAVKETKTAGGHRVVPLRPEIRHLVARPRGAPGRGAVVDEPIEKGAKLLREHLRAAGVRRARLFTESATELPIDFRSLRDTYATWRALGGVEAYVLRREMGHESLETTDRYIRLAGAVKDAAIGAPFPALPIPFPEGLAAVAAGGGVSAAVSAAMPVGSFREENSLAPTAGLEPATRRLTAACSTN